MPSMPHMGFAKVASGIASKEGMPIERAKAVLATGARRASAKAVSANPKLRKVSGVKY